MKMTEKEKPATTQSKNFPKDGQVIISIMKETGILDYEPKTVLQLTEIVYRYATSILDEARMYANSKKKSLGIDDVRLALQLTSESSFTTPPPREVILGCANVKNYTPLPLVKVHCGLRLPPDRHCLSSCNYALKSSQYKKKLNYGSPNSGSPIKISAKPGANYAKRGSPLAGKAIAAPRPLTKITTGSPNIQKTVVPKIQITHNVHVTGNGGSGAPMDIENTLKRKRDDDSDL